MALLEFWNAIVYFGSLVILGASIWKAATLAVLVSVSAFIGYGRKWIFRFGFILMFVTIFVALSILPPADQWWGVLAKLANSHFVT